MAREEEEREEVGDAFLDKKDPKPFFFLVLGEPKGRSKGFSSIKSFGPPSLVKEFSLSVAPSLFLLSELTIPFFFECVVFTGLTLLSEVVDSFTLGLPIVCVVVWMV